jgi:Na+-transporting NADH:ubiquinone oxidoreductase subunit A
VTATQKNGAHFFRLAKGLDPPSTGAPQQVSEEAAETRSVGLLTADYPGLRASLRVSEGERIAVGQPLFADREDAQIVFTSPGAGIVSTIQTDARRELAAVTVKLDGDDEVRFLAHRRDELAGLDCAQVSETLLASGLWTALRTRPFGRVPKPTSQPHALFVQATDTNPLAAAPSVVLTTESDAFVDGLTVLSRLLDGAVFLCAGPTVALPAELPAAVTVARFAGPHPAGLPGTHIHTLSPVGPDRTVWYIGYQDVVAIGKLFTSGRPAVERVVALGGPIVLRPRLLRTRLGASTRDLVRDELADTACRVISGSMLSGRTASGQAGYLGRYHVQVSVIGENRGNEARRSFRSRFFGFTRRRVAATTSLHGRPGPMVPIEAFERVVPLDLLVTPLLRALLVGDIEAAEALGCLELEEEDLALCSYLCPGKNDYGRLLRSVLDQIGGAE